MNHRTRRESCVGIHRKRLKTRTRIYCGDPDWLKYNCERNKCNGALVSSMSQMQAVLLDIISHQSKQAAAHANLFRIEEDIMCQLDIPPR